MKVLKGNISYTYCVKEYCARLRNHIKNNYCPTTSNKEGMVSFQLIIVRGGALCFINQVGSTGCDYLDQYAKDTVEKSFPFESFPERTFQTYIDILIPIKFTIM